VREEQRLVREIQIAVWLERLQERDFPNLPPAQARREVLNYFAACGMSRNSGEEAVDARGHFSACTQSSPAKVMDQGKAGCYHAAMDAARQEGDDLTSWLEYCAEGLEQTLERVWEAARWDLPAALSVWPGSSRSPSAPS